MKEKRTTMENILVALDLCAGFCVFITRDMILQFPLLKKTILCCFSIILVSYLFI